MDPRPRILVTGAGGFVGGWLLARLPDRLPPDAVILGFGGAVPHGVAGGDLDVTCASDVDAAVARFRPTGVVHLAAVSSLTEARLNARRAWDVNLFGTLNLAEAVMRHAPEATFVFASSSEVYGGSFHVGSGGVDETALLDPRNPYAVTKAAADLALGQMAETGLRALRFRPFNHTGPGQSVDFAIPSFATQIAEIERGTRPPVLRVGNLEARRDFLDVRDVVEAYVLAVASPRPVVPGIFNLASGRPQRMADVLDDLLAMSAVPITVERDPALMRPTDIPLTIGNARRVWDSLGWRPAIPWTTTLRDTLDARRRGLA